MYSRYERFWHWAQAAAVVMLLLTGVEIHWPQVGVFGYSAAVKIHRVVGVVLAVNALSSLIYHLLTGRIRQFVPRRRGLVGRLTAQVRFYLAGIFRGEPHPIPKTPRNKLNPLQQIGYMGLLNLLLPVLTVSGLLLLLAPQLPGVIGAVGGLGLPAKIHTLGAWLMVSFFVVHIYLTTTGHSPTALTRAMVTGWEETPAPDPLEETASAPAENDVPPEEES